MASLLPRTETPSNPAPQKVPGLEVDLTVPRLGNPPTPCGRCGVLECALVRSALGELGHYPFPCTRDRPEVAPSRCVQCSGFRAAQHQSVPVGHLPRNARRQPPTVADRRIDLLPP